VPGDLPRIGAVLLGAGFSRRFGADKRLQPLSSSTVAETTLSTYCSAFAHVRVVIRADDDTLAAKLRRYDCEITISADARLGMGHSLAAGITGVDWAWAFVGLLDMPFVQRATLLTLIDAAARQPEPRILRPRLRTDGKDGIPYGHPIGWHQQYFPELRALHGDQGARQLLRTHRAEIMEIVLDDPGIVQDIDTPADLR